MARLAPVLKAVSLAASRDAKSAGSIASNNFFLVMASAVGLFSGYLQELYVRKTYVGQKIIEAKNALSSLLLAEALHSDNFDRKEVDRTITEEALALLQREDATSPRRYSTVLYQPH